MTPPTNSTPARPGLSAGVSLALAASALALAPAACSTEATDQQSLDPQGSAQQDPKKLTLRHGLELAPADVPEDLGERAYAHCNTVVSFGPRFVGSKGWRDAITFIHREIKRMELNAIHDRWAVESEQLTFENIHATIPGQVPDRIVIGCHHDTKCTQGHADEAQNYRFVGANDSGSGVGLLLALADVLRQRENYATIQLVFFDGEESIPYAWDDGRSLFGSQRFVEQYLARQESGQDTSTIRAFVLLDMVGRKDLNIDEVTNSSTLMRDVAYAAARGCGEADHFFQYSWPVKDDHAPFHAEEIPTLNLIDLKFNAEWHTADDTMEHISAESLHTVGRVVLTALPELEQRLVKNHSEKAPIKFR